MTQARCARGIVFASFRSKEKALLRRFTEGKKLS